METELEHVSLNYPFSSLSSRIKQKVSMETLVDKQQKEFIRKTIQRQEETFKHQVQELHRLYSVQKMLTDELKKDAKQKRNCANFNPNLTSQSIDFSCNNNNKFTKSRKEIEIEEDELELSLSIGLSSSPSSKSSKRRIYQEHDSSPSSRSDMSSSNTTSDQEKNRPHWLFQGLSINRS